jgi:hypothetical protein
VFGDDASYEIIRDDGPTVQTGPLRSLDSKRCLRALTDKTPFKLTERSRDRHHRLAEWTGRVDSEIESDY